ncbi:hypothetical protein [Vibrio chagasii]|uniref:hypothetical protein n=1 Tax=Vibrio chagasii TaxID=170679 RepID=UPI0022850C85|nr:hypothetical protein [Vibrio chagasii]MCY9827736.1 hypothetical protein [Vibrio chagasii]
MAREMRLAIIATAISALAGCGDSEIDTVKNSFYSDSETVSMGNLLDNRSICSSVTWDVFETEQNTTTVEYRCYLSGAKELFTSQLEQAKSEHDRKETNKLERLKEAYQRKLEAISTYEKEIPEREITTIKWEKNIRDLKETIQDKEKIYADGLKRGQKQVDLRNTISSLRAQYNKLNMVDKRKDLTRMEENLKSYKSEVHQDLAEIEAFTPVPFQGKLKYKNMYELWQWGFNQNGLAIPTYTGLVQVKPNGEENIGRKSTDMMYQLANSEHQNLRSYILSFSMLEFKYR